MDGMTPTNSLRETLSRHASQGHTEGEATIDKEGLEILSHTRFRTAGLFCGDSPAMQRLVAAGLMKSRGKTAWCPDEYFSMTPEGEAFLKAALSKGNPDV